MTEAGSYNRIPLLSLLYSAATAFWLIVVGIYRLYPEEAL